ncbi:unnamed protein product [Caretta caretta]
MPRLGTHSPEGQQQGQLRGKTRPSRSLTSEHVGAQIPGRDPILCCRSSAALPGAPRRESAWSRETAATQTQISIGNDAVLLKCETVFFLTASGAQLCISLSHWRKTNMLQIQLLSRQT